MKNLILIGAGGFGREIYDLSVQTKEHGVEYKVKGFLDDNLRALDKFDNYPPVISSIKDYMVEENDVFICAIGDISLKKKKVNLILEKGGVFLNLIHPTSIINSNVKLGKGIIILSYTNISNDCQIGSFTTIQPHCILGHDVKVGEYCHMNSFSFMGGESSLEEEVLLNTRSTLLPKVKVCRGAKVGAASLVIRNVKKDITVFGSPAKQLKF